MLQKDYNRFRRYGIYKAHLIHYLDTVSYCEIYLITFCLHTFSCHVYFTKTWMLVPKVVKYPRLFNTTTPLT